MLLVKFSTGESTPAWCCIPHYWCLHFLKQNLQATVMLCDLLRDTKPLNSVFCDKNEQCSYQW